MVFKKMTQIVVALEAYILHLSTMGNIFLQGLFQGELNGRCLFNKMAAQTGLNFQMQLFLTNKGKKYIRVLDTISQKGLKRQFWCP